MTDDEKIIRWRHVARYKRDFDGTVTSWVHPDYKRELDEADPDYEDAYAQTYRDRVMNVGWWIAGLGIVVCAIAWWLA